jgi:hypothetical protein
MTHPPLPHDPGLVKARLQGDLAAVLDRLGVVEREQGGKITPLNPTRNDRRPGSFVIWTRGDAAGAWKDYATGEAGDLYQLIQYLGGLARWIDAYWWALAHLGLERGEIRTRAADQAERDRRERDRKAFEAKEAQRQAEKSAALFRLWLGLPASIAGTPAERYLRQARRLPIERLPYPPNALRWCERAEWIDPETGEVKTWRHMMVAAVTVGSKVTGLHRTFLTPDGAAKREGPGGRSKMMIGTTRGGAIRLSRGRGGLTPAEAVAKGKPCPLMIGEGIETTLTAAIARPDYRAWAAGSLDHMGLIDWPACASAVVLLRDNDWKEEALAAFERVRAGWEAKARGRPLEVVTPPAGDLNDMVRG